MKKRILVLVLILLALFVVYLNISDVFNQKEKVIGTGKVITGNATSGGVAISITVTGSPTLTLLEPENETYFTNKNLELNFTADSADNIWYKLDSGSNVTITENTIFNSTSGQHTLYLFANNTYGNSSESVIFTTNETKFIIYYNNYTGQTKGESTNFNKSSYEEIQSLSGIILENTHVGKIAFNEAVNLTNDRIYTDNILDLDSYTNISSNFIEINTTARPNFNKSATLYLYNLTFTNPRVLRNRESCPETICTEVSYNQGTGTFIFNVTQFTNYSAEETPVEEEVIGGGGGGGTTAGKFEVLPEKIHVTVKQGETREKILIITNTGTATLTVYITEKDLSDFIKITNFSFSLNKGESKEIILDFLAKEEAAPKIYVGKVIIKAGGIEKEILIAMNIESKESLFDVNVEIPSRYLKVAPGEDILADVKIYNLGAIKRVDALVEYIVEDQEGNLITIIRNTVAVETQASLTKTINIPDDTTFGIYVLYVRVTYDEKISGSSVFFEIGLPGISQREKLYIIIIILLLIILSLVIYLRIMHQRKEHRKRAGGSKGSAGESFSDYKKSLGKKITK